MAARCPAPVRAAQRWLQERLLCGLFGRVVRPVVLRRTLRRALRRAKLAALVAPSTRVQAIAAHLPAHCGDLRARLHARSLVLSSGE